MQVLQKPISVRRTASMGNQKEKESSDLEIRLALVRFPLGEIRLVETKVELVAIVIMISANTKSITMDRRLKTRVNHIERLLCKQEQTSEK